MRRALTFLFLLISISAVAIERQPSSDYHARREALAKKANAAVLVFAGTEAAGQNDLYGFRQDNNFFYLTGWTEPGAAILVAPARPAAEDKQRFPTPKSCSFLRTITPRNVGPDPSSALKIRRLPN